MLRRFVALGSLIWCFSLFVVAEEGVGQGGGGAGEGGEEGAAHRRLLRDMVRALRSDGAGHRDGTPRPLPFSHPLILFVTL